MSNWNVNIEILIRKYKNGSLSNSEAVYLAEWVKSSSQNAQHFRTVVRTIEQLDSQHNVQAERFCKRVIEKEFNKKSARKAALLPHLNNRWRIAAITSAVATVAIVLGVVFGGRNSSIDVEAPVINGATEEITIASVPTLEYKAPKDAPMHIVLVDGTKITLNQNSLLTLSDDYNIAERNVTLDGEAYFDVAKSEKQFTVTAGDKRYIVHGTSFNILSFKDDKYSIVTLHTGKLEAKIDAQSYMLKPGDELRVDDNTKSISKHIVNTENSIGWMNNQLTFSRLPLKFVIKQIEHKYNVKINMHSDIEDIPYTGELQNENLKTALHLLSITAPITLEVTESNNEFYISKK